MRRILSAGIILTTLFALTSCATAITVGKNVESYKLKNVYSKPVMDFIGFKIDTNILSTTISSKVSTGVWTPDIDVVTSEFDQAKAISSTKSLRQLGYTLETDGIAFNKADAYFGIYSLQEMELYKSDSRYVTFVEVAQSKLDYKDNKGTKRLLGGIGGGLVGAGIPFMILGSSYKGNPYATGLANFYSGYGIGCSIAGAFFLIPALSPSKTDVNFSGVYNIYLYDTQTKSLIRKEAVTVNCSETFTGSYTYDDSSKEIVRDYISENVSNKILEKYDELNNWLVNKN